MLDFMFKNRNHMPLDRGNMVTFTSTQINAF